MPSGTYPFHHIYLLRTYTNTLPSQRVLASAKADLAARRSEQPAAATTTSPLSPGEALLVDPGIQQLISSLQTPQSPAVQPQPTVPQAETPIEVEIALRTIAQLEDYDASFAKTREYYVRALARARGQVNSPVEPVQQGSVDAARDPRLAKRASFGPAGTGPLRTSSLGGAGEVDVSRDPRRR